MKVYGRVDIYIHVFLTSALIAGECSDSRPGRFTPGNKAPGSHRVGGWVSPTACLDAMEKRKSLTLPGFELRLLSRPVSSQSLYPMRYPGSWAKKVKLNKLQRIYFLLTLACCLLIRFQSSTFNLDTNFNSCSVKQREFNYKFSDMGQQHIPVSGHFSIHSKI
jgi:hypothetical protein